MFEAIKKTLGKFDWLLLIAAVFLFTHFDYSDLKIVDIIYMVTFTLWFCMLLFRIYINYSGKKFKDRKKLK